MKSFKIIGLIVWALCLAACNQVKEAHYLDEAGHQVDEERYASGQLKHRTIYQNSEKSDFIKTSYYENGMLLDSAVFVNNRLHGTKIYFDQTLGLTHTERYQDGIMQGLNEAVYNNGAYSYSGFRQQGQKAGEWFFYYPDGRPITYEFYDSTGRLKYFRKYDENGHYQQSDGNVIIDAKLLPNQVAAGQPATLGLLLAMPSGLTTRVEINASLGADTIHDTFVADKARLEIPLTFNQPGEATVLVRVSITDEITDHAETGQQALRLIIN